MDNEKIKHQSRMLTLFKKAALIAVLTAAVIVVLLSWPAATWLQCKELQTGNHETDTVYLVAGAEDIVRRIDAVVQFVENNRNTNERMVILVGNDTMQKYWSDSENRYLTEAESTVVKLNNALIVATSDGMSREYPPDIRIVPGRILGTDEEMEALSVYLEDHREINSVILASSPFHLRRVVNRITNYLKHPVVINVLSAREQVKDRMPSVVLLELCKMARDKMGLSRAQFLSRSGWFCSKKKICSRFARGFPDNAFACFGFMNMGLIAVLVYAWILYPLILKLAVWKRIRRDAPVAAGWLPGRISILISAYNEETHIGACLENLVKSIKDLKTTMPVKNIDILVGVDGSADKTAEIAGTIAVKHGIIHVHNFEQRRGKVSVLKELVCESRRDKPESGQEGDDGHILVFTDANTKFKQDALKKLIGHFADPGIGGVCGRLILGSAGFVSGTEQVPDVLSEESVYWNMEAVLKGMESRLDSCLGANGAIYAVRDNLFRDDIPDNTIVEDFVIGMKVREKGSRMVYDSEAIAVEALPDVSHEWHRRVRIGAGDFQALQFCRRCLLPRYGRFAWMFWSHKVLRWITPHIMLVVILTAVIQQWWVMSFSCGTIHLYPTIGLMNYGILAALVLGVTAAFFNKGFRLAGLTGPVLFRCCDHFLTMQAALFVGFLRFCRGNLRGEWRRTPR